MSILKFLKTMFGSPLSSLNRCVRKMTNAVMAVLTTCFLFNEALCEDLYDIMEKAGESIRTNFKTQQAIMREYEKLDKILNDQNLSDNDKIEKIKKIYLSSTMISQTNLVGEYREDAE